MDATTGGITIKATDAPIIDSTAYAASAAASLSFFGSLTIAGAGAEALNVILTKTRAYATASDLRSAGDITIEASDTSTISAVVKTVAAGFSVGYYAGAVSIGTGTAHNYVGRDDQPLKCWPTCPAPAPGRMPGRSG